MIISISLKFTLPLDKCTNIEMDLYGDYIDYHHCLYNIIDQYPNVSLLILPYCMDHDSGRYSYSDFIAQIRMDKNNIISRLPIVICGGEEEINEEEWDKIIFSHIGVGITVDRPSATILNEAIEYAKENRNEIAVEKYIEMVTSKSFSETYSHDQANRWGAYALKRAISLVNNISESNDLECILLNDPYYKNIIQNLDGSESERIVDRKINSLKSKIYDRKTNLPEKILIVEDQLEDGWKSAYTELFNIIGNTIMDNELVIFVKTVEEAKIKIQSCSDIGLILLDVRLTEDDRRWTHQDESGNCVDDLSGVKLAKYIRRHHNTRTVPIIAATASSKSWTLEALLEQGINSYWVKGHPSIINTNALVLESTGDLVGKVNMVMKWSFITKSWVDDLYNIADIVSKTDKTNGLILEKKAKSLHALLFKSFTPFTKTLSAGLQWNMAFLEIFSCMNDLSSWVCEKKQTKSKISWSMKINGTLHRVVEGYIDDDVKWKVADSPKSKLKYNFPDTEIASKILLNYGMIPEQNIFNKKDDKQSSVKIRNSLPLIHGKYNDGYGDQKSIDATEDNISDLVSVLRSLTNKHSEMLIKGLHRDSK
jgi:CheY-like chemotaxis protein